MNITTLADCVEVVMISKFGQDAINRTYGAAAERRKPQRVGKLGALDRLAALAVFAANNAAGKEIIPPKWIEASNDTLGQMPVDAAGGPRPNTTTPSKPSQANSGEDQTLSDDDQALLAQLAAIPATDGIARAAFITKHGDRLKRLQRKRSG